MDLVLVSTPLKSDATHRGLCPSLSNLTLGSHLARQGASVRVFDPSVEIETSGVTSSNVLDEIARQVVAMNARLVGLSCLSPVEGKFAAALARRVRARDPDLPIVMGGLWSSTYALEILQQVSAVDAVVTGPGELPLQRLLQSSHGRALSWDDAPGLQWRTGHTEPPPAYTAALAAPLDLSLLRYPERYDIMVYLSSRGCPYRCAFCSEPLMFPNYVDEPIDKVRSDIAAFAGVGRPYYFWLCDPIFGFSPRRVEEMCDLLEPTPFEFLIESRVDVLQPDMVDRVARAGCRLIYFGLESGASRSLLELSKCRNLSHVGHYLDGARALVERCAEQGVVAMLGVMNPVPGDGPEDLAESLSFLEELVSISRAIDPDLGLVLLPLGCRLDMGSPFQRHWRELAARGVTRACDEHAIFQDMNVRRASPSVGPDEGAAFRAAVRALWTPTPRAQETLALSFPRPYLEVEWN